MCCAETCTCGTGHLLSVRYPEQVPQELPQDSETISTLVRPRLLTETVLAGELYATYNTKDFYGEAVHTKFYELGVGIATEHLHMHGIVYKGLQPENVLLTAKDLHKNNFENLIDYRKMVTDVITVAGNIDSETVKDFGFESHIEDRKTST